LKALETFIFPHFPPGFNALQIGGKPENLPFLVKTQRLFYRLW
jgi:hypothetical protein